MRLHEIQPAPGSRTKKTRRGRGLGSGLGKTAGRGHKGQKARSGGSIRPGFEGGQMPLQRRLPKRGFVNPFRVEYEVVNVGDLNQFEPNTVVTIDLLKNRRLVRRNLPVKILGEGELDRPLTVQVNAFSKSAKEKIEAVSGRAEVI
ncbi:50S ribosomal protein L15 [Sulfobacillus thermosulfidooxidans]|uniref:Large ribosomal subunit protein uL15 n=2 Tax=Sulfobacillus thermosulfidooxidans TaxID=28034 RepID=A0A1W1W994_SULTA|nr:50S ribosomal protein L15 [Sulfobacillus thermosulfidooxidans]OLZ10935.1 50S ribosomal protein L15 [Sulfobacillus thermosulfidooxidans]OLZ14423.1 50S ribosomal protein L15 [Sulfobacillus thermosulfidooxidans]OLZ19166.1 50S ribosomal protein L15 [Sulfobacillus thermosulfidooxidans]PSR28451.1 MAG: 50S ribosomal protein L15 [Sulfobacillus thermosulfidooxidans]SMC02878.1 LSU ribosomal protein L15P [Sulfobacillus thermosulfidooxidans DSM 9293]